MKTLKGREPDHEKTKERKHEKRREFRDRGVWKQLSTLPFVFSSFRDFVIFPSEIFGGHRLKYSFRQDSSAARSGVPLGGIGTGGVEYRPDGRFYDWNIFNNFPYSHHGPKSSGLGQQDAYFAIRVKGEADMAQVRVLSVADSCPDTDPYTFPWLRYVKEISYDGRFPFIRTEYIDENLPVRVKMEAFSPFIPHDLKNSSIPAAAFTFTIKNTSDENIEASLLFFLKNGVLYDQPNPKRFVRDEVWERITMLVFGADGDESLPTYGTMCVACDGEDVDTYAGYRYDLPWQEQYPAKLKYWSAFRNTGRMPQDGGDFGQAGTVSCKVRLDPGESKKVTFYLGWHFPNLIGKEPQNDFIGHFYNTHLTDAGDAVVYLKNNLKDLYKRSRAFGDSIFKSSVAEWFAEPVMAQLTTLIKSAWYGEKGEFAVWEGLGCCGLQTTDVGYYGSIPIALFFPELEKWQMLLTSKFPKDDGRVPHLFPGTFEEVDETGYIRIDMIPQWVLMLYRDYLWFDDRAFLAEVWPFTKNAMEYLHKQDEDNDGLPNNKGIDQTYDQWKFFGTSAYVGCLYIASLKAAVEMANAMGEPDLARTYKERLDKATKNYIEELWNEEYFILWNDVAKGEKDEGVMGGALDGQWYAHLLDMGYVLPEEMVKKHLRAAMKYNFHPEQGLLNGAYPPGTVVPEQAITSFQVSTPWTGTEYAVASHLLEESMYEEAIAVVMAVDERYWERSLYWDHQECGGHYYRAMVVWALLLSFAGQRYDATKQKLSMAPAFPQCKLPLVLPTFFGEFALDSEIVIKPTWGELTLKSLSVANFVGNIFRAQLGSKEVAFELRQDGYRTEIVFAEPVVIRGKAALKVILD